MELPILLYLFVCFFVAFVFGTARKIGFWICFLACIVLTPLIGFILTLFSTKNSTIEARNKSLELQEKQLHAIQQSSKGSTADELEKLIKLRESGKISELEFESLKKKLF